MTKLNGIKKIPRIGNGIKKNNPEQNDKCAQFQTNTKLDLEAAMPNPKMPNLVQSQEPAKKTSMEGAITTNCESSQASTPSSMKKKTTIFPRKRVLPMPKRKGRVAVAPAHAEVTTSDEELLMVTKMIEKEVLAKAMRKTKEDEAAQGGGRATMVAENTMGVKPPPPTQAEWCHAKIANPSAKQEDNGS